MKGLIRRYVEADRPTVWALSQIPHIGETADPTAPLDLSPRDDPGNFDDLYDIEGTHLRQGGEFLVYELDSRVVAMGGFTRGGSGRAQVDYVRVHPAMRRRGIGRAVMEALERRAIELGFEEMHLDTTVGQPEAIAFYQGIGYRECGRQKFPAWELVFFMKELDGSS